MFPHPVICISRDDRAFFDLGGPDHSMMSATYLIAAGHYNKRETQYLFKCRLRSVAKKRTIPNDEETSIDKILNDFSGKTSEDLKK